LLSYWMERKVDGQYADFWVKVPSIPASPGKTTIYIYYGNPQATRADNPLEVGIWQVREHQTHSSYYPNFAFSKPSAGVIRIGGSGATDLGDGYLFIIVPRSYLHGKKVQIYWNAYSSGTGASSFRIYIVNAELHRAQSLSITSITNIFQYKLAVDYGAVTGGWGGWKTSTSGVLDLSAFTSSYVALLICLGDGDTLNKVMLDVDWVKILDANNNVLMTFDFTEDLIMEVTNTYEDYGVVRKRVSPEPSHGAWGSEESSISRPRIDVGTPTQIFWTVKRQYDDSAVTSFVITVARNGQPWYSGSASYAIDAVNVAGKYVYSVASIVDNTYNITAFDANTVEVTWEKVVFALSAARERVNVGEAAQIFVNAYYASDGSPFQGSYVLNDTNMVMYAVGKKGFGVASMSETLYGITAFESRGVSVIWDRPVVQSLDFDYYGNLQATVVSEYDGEPLDYTLDESTGRLNCKYGLYTYVAWLKFSYGASTVKVAKTSGSLGLVRNDPAKKKFVFTADAGTVKVWTDYGAPKAVLRDWEWFAGWSYDASKRTLTINSPGSTYAVVTDPINLVVSISAQEYDDVSDADVNVTLSDPSGDPLPDLEVQLRVTGRAVTTVYSKVAVDGLAAFEFSVPESYAYALKADVVDPAGIYTGSATGSAKLTRLVVVLTPSTTWAQPGVPVTIAISVTRELDNSTATNFRVTVRTSDGRTLVVSSSSFTDVQYSAATTYTVVAAEDRQFSIFTFVSAPVTVIWAQAAGLFTFRGVRVDCDDLRYRGYVLKVDPFNTKLERDPNTVRTLVILNATNHTITVSRTVSQYVYEVVVSQKVQGNVYALDFASGVVDILVSAPEKAIRIIYHPGTIIAIPKPGVKPLEPTAVPIIAPNPAIMPPGYESAISIIMLGTLLGFSVGLARGSSRPEIGIAIASGLVMLVGVVLRLDVVVAFSAIALTVAVALYLARRGAA